MMEGAVAAQHARTAGWSARFLEAVPAAVLGAVLVSLVGLFGWMAISLVTLQTRVGKLETRVEEGFEQTNARLTRLETRVDDLNDRVNDIYARLNDIYKLLAEERLPPPPEQNPQQR